MFRAHLLALWLCILAWSSGLRESYAPLPGVSMTLKKWGHYPKLKGHGPFFKGRGDSRYMCSAPSTP